LAKKEVKKEKTKTTQKKEKSVKASKKTKSKKDKDTFVADDGLVIIDEQIEEDKEAELEARKAYLEEARSQEVDD
jgi:ribose 5-phosphate isomerase